MARSGSSAWGWHRLDDRFAAQFVTDARIRPGELVLDVGAGTGALTEHLVAAGARVVAVEAHKGRADVLRRKFERAPVVVVRADAADLRLPRRPFRVVANPPFTITTPLLRRLLASGSRLERADLILQRASARRWAVGDVRGAPRWAREFAIEIGNRLPRNAFHPRPQVDVATVIITRR